MAKWEREREGKKERKKERERERKKEREREREREKERKKENYGLKEIITFIKIQIKLIANTLLNS